MSVFRFVRAVVEGEPLNVFGDGSQLRDFSYVDDIARGVIASLRPCGFRIFNLGADNPARLSHIIELIEKACGRRALIRYEARDTSDAPATWADVSRARSELNWEPEVALEEGIRRTLNWYLENREWASRLVSPPPPIALPARAAM